MALRYPNPCASRAANRSQRLPFNHIIKFSLSSNLYFSCPVKSAKSFKFLQTFLSFFDFLRIAKTTGFDFFCHPYFQSLLLSADRYSTKNKDISRRIIIKNGGTLKFLIHPYINIYSLIRFPFLLKRPNPISIPAIFMIGRGGLSDKFWSIIIFSSFFLILFLSFRQMGCIKSPILDFVARKPLLALP